MSSIEVLILFDNFSSDSFSSTLALSNPIRCPLLALAWRWHADDTFSWCSLSLWHSIRSVLPMYPPPHVLHYKQYTTIDLSSTFSTLSLNGNIEPMVISAWNVAWMSSRNLIHVFNPSSFIRSMCFLSKCDMNTFANNGPNGEPIATPSIWS